jgi:heme b synthase
MGVVGRCAERTNADDERRKGPAPNLCHCGFVILSSFGFRHSSFPHIEARAVDQAGRETDSPKYLPHLIAWEVTRTCPLACKHCRAAAQPTPYPGELTTDEGKRLLDNIASFARPTMILTGGEPMLRPDIYELAGYAHRLGLPVVMAPCGMYVTAESVTRMRKGGISCISISLDGATAAPHDAFRGVPGAFDAALRAIETARQGGMAFQINTTVTRENAGELPALLELAARLRAAAFNPFLLVPTGRGKELAGEELSAEEYEETLRWLAEQSDRKDIHIRVTCAPHYTRILRQHRKATGCDAAAARALPPHEHPGEAPAAKGCLGGKTFAFISHVGKVQICGFMDIICGDLREGDFDFRNIWEHSEVFRKVRDPQAYRGKCGACEYRRICGGCRARAFAVTGDYLAEEPFCAYQPSRRSEE